jgi:hypothetical protein
MYMYLVKSRLYILRVQCDITNDNNAAEEKFFQSFEVIEKPVKAPEKSRNKGKR